MLVADFEQFDEQRLSVEQRCAIANADPAHNPNIGRFFAIERVIYYTG